MPAMLKGVPFFTDYLPDNRGAVQIATGELLAAEIIAELERLRLDPERHRPHEYVLVDFSGMTSFRLSVSDLRNIIRHQRAIATEVPKIAMAIVTPKDAAFGMARMWEALAHGLPWEARVFRSRAEGIAWLRIRRPGCFPDLAASEEQHVQSALRFPAV